VIARGAGFFSRGNEGQPPAAFARASKSGVALERASCRIPGRRRVRAARTGRQAFGLWGNPRLAPHLLSFSSTVPNSARFRTATAGSAESGA